MGVSEIPFLHLPQWTQSGGMASPPVHFFMQIVHRASGKSVTNLQKSKGDFKKYPKLQIGQEKTCKYLVDFKRGGFSLV